MYTLIYSFTIKHYKSLIGLVLCSFSIKGTHFMRFKYSLSYPRMISGVGTSVCYGLPIRNAIDMLKDIDI